LSASAGIHPGAGLVDRELGGAKSLTAAGLRLHAAARLRDLLPIWKAQGKLSTEQVGLLMGDNENSMVG
jgi:hypothetical protein